MDSQEIYQFLLDGYSKLEILKFSKKESSEKRKTLIKTIADFPSSKRVQQNNIFLKRSSIIIFMNYVLFYALFSFFVWHMPTAPGVVGLILVAFVFIPFYKNFRLAYLTAHYSSLIVSLILPFYFIAIAYNFSLLENKSRLHFFIFGTYILMSLYSLFCISLGFRLVRVLFNYQVFSRYSYNEETGKVTFFDEEETISQ